MEDLHRAQFAGVQLRGQRGAWWRFLCRNVSTFNLLCPPPTAFLRSLVQ